MAECKQLVLLSAFPEDAYDADVPRIPHVGHRVPSVVVRPRHRSLMD